MERLTYWNEEYNCWSYKCASGEAAKRLAYFEDLQEQGRLIVDVVRCENCKLTKIGEFALFCTRFQEYRLDDSYCCFGESALTDK